MDKRLKVGEDEWRERERGEQNFERERRGRMMSKLQSLISQIIKVAKCTHKASTYSLSVTQNWREI